MAISINSIIHYTDTIEKLKGILLEGFQVKYCLEETSTKIGLKIYGAYPMVCFCDIPLSDTKNHLASYGHYGIGLHKKWATANGLNPVVYIDKFSDIGYSLSMLFKMGKNEKGEYDNDYITNSIKIFSYLKNYEGHLIRAGRDEENYRFYDEKEWRYVPPDKLMEGATNVAMPEKYLSDKDKYNKAIKHIKLNFTFEDISYIIVKEETDIPEIAKQLRHVYADKCTVTQLEILLTRIITASQVINDF